MSQPRVLIIDALNMYFRAYIVDPSLSTNGQPIGGVKGFLKILQKLVRETKPDHIVIAWDGAGGSQKRKAVNKGYKEGRKPIRLNRDIRTLTENEELKNKVWQQTRLIEYLNEMPISQTMLPAVEADDVIAFVSRLSSFADWQKVIVSSDKDFFQLCDDNTVVLRPIQKQVINTKRLVEEYSIHPNNMALARAIAGDTSDNLPGINGVGLGTIKKRFPFFADEEFCTIDRLMDFCDEAESNLKAFSSILEGRAVVEQNYKLMQLYAPSLSPQGKSKVRFAIEDAEQLFNKTGVQGMMIEDGFGTFDWSSLFQCMRRIVVDNK
jgi:DNA polymerase-1|tara:strand:- start:217 stop:1182 length:966 start_codon:yes stop_codon:yes gene_type:complete